ncbi:hypothetical protein BJ508DRAFT_334433 [Ascobolus immersus RN42]|uniref:Uncharacterized protein n=1 Tax=Ascobolus immersus RN42 TaxID=1160509 RepID=A0A3N4HTU7_ASCIM|nr:hypothetical protein BJ508DRAFT_334433 [Ascobolus immersus RN42]
MPLRYCRQCFPFVPLIGTRLQHSRGAKNGLHLLVVTVAQIGTWTYLEGRKNKEKIAKDEKGEDAVELHTTSPNITTNTTTMSTFNSILRSTRSVHSNFIIIRRNTYNHTLRNCITLDRVLTLGISAWPLNELMWASGALDVFKCIKADSKIN